MLEIIGYIILVFGCLCGIGNWCSAISAIITKGSTSFIPFIGAILMVVGVFITGNKSIQYYWWLAFIIEFTALPILILGAIQKTKESQNKNT